MKKRILSYATIIFSTFLLTSRVNAISCEYGVFDSANSTADGFESKITLIFDKNQGSITIDYNNSPFIKDSEYCSNTSNEGSGLTNNSGNTISCKYWNIGHWDQKNYILGDTLAQETLDYTLKAYGDECRKNINVYDQTIFYTSSETVPSVTNNDDSAILYNYPACITFEEDQEALPCEGEYSDAISYTFFLKGTTEADRKMAEEENNSVDLSNLSLEQIKEMYKDIVEFPDDLIGALSFCNIKTSTNPDNRF